MIFVTVGTQLPFDRLVTAVDNWASYTGRSDVFMQIGNGMYLPKQAKYERDLSPADFEECARSADVLVAHSGMGSILTALELAKPLVLLPREARYGEHRNDHQIATAEKFRAMPNIFIASKEGELASRIEQATAVKGAAAESLPPVAPPEFITAVASFIESSHAL